MIGLLSDAVTGRILNFALNVDTTAATVRAFNKLFWIQNDFVNRHYQANDFVT